MIYLDLDDLLHVARRCLGEEPQVIDVGLLESAVMRPQVTVLQEDAYDSIHAKGAALLHSLARNHGLVDGNKRLALAALLAFYGINGIRLTLSNDEAFDLVMDVASGQLDAVADIAPVLRQASVARP